MKIDSKRKNDDSEEEKKSEGDLPECKGIFVAKVIKNFNNQMASTDIKKDTKLRKRAKNEVEVMKTLDPKHSVKFIEDLE